MKGKSDKTCIILKNHKNEIKDFFAPNDSSLTGWVAVKSTAEITEDLEQYEDGVTYVSRKGNDIVSELSKSIKSREELLNFFREYGFFINTGSNFEIISYDLVIQTRNLLLCLAVVKQELEAPQTDYDILLRKFRELISYKGICLVSGHYPDNSVATRYMIPAPYENMDIFSKNYIENYAILNNGAYKDENGNVVLDADLYILLNKSKCNMDDNSFDTYMDTLSKCINKGVDNFVLDTIGFYKELSQRHKDAIKKSVPNPDYMVDVFDDRKYIEIFDPFSVDDLASKDLTPELESKLVNLAKQICYYYVNEGIKDIHFEIDPTDGKQIIVIPNLLSAIFYHLSVFDFRKYKYCKCALPKCINWKSKLRTEQRPRYCCTKHSRCNASAEHRKRELETGIKKSRK